MFEKFRSHRSDYLKDSDNIYVTFLEEKLKMWNDYIRDFFFFFFMMTDYNFATNRRLLRGKMKTI